MAVLDESLPKAMKSPKKDEKKVFLVAQELQLARFLAGNSKPSRDRALKNLKKWFVQRLEAMPFTEDDLLRIWKGLFYSMWMSDKPLIQEECAENISQLMHFGGYDMSLLYFKAGLITLINEWFGIDQLRLDKFLMLVRRLLRQAFFVLKNDNFAKKAVDFFTGVVDDTILSRTRKVPLGLSMHFTEIYLEELAKVSQGKVNLDRLTDLVKPFIRKLAFSSDSREINHIRKFIFNHLMKQSDLGIEYEEKYEAWKKLGFPGNIDAMQKIEIEENQEEETESQEESLDTPLDPRAGRVDVELPSIKFSSKLLVKALNDVKFDKNTSTKSRQILNCLAEQFQKLASGVYPLGTKQLSGRKKDHDLSIRKAVNRLVKFDNQIMGKGKRGKKRKRETDSEQEQTEAKKVKRNEKTKPKQKKDNVEYVFQRNSGVWVVYVEKNKKIKLGEASKEGEAVSNLELSNSVEEKNTKRKVNPKELFPKTEWDEPLKDGEYEIVIPARKYVKRLKETKKNDKEVQDMINSTLEKIRGKSKVSLDASVVKNPFSTPNSAKKVKINVKLNQSQEVHEHINQLLSSPGIPYDANKKPSKPLLKTPKSSTPLNPFYKNRRRGSKN